MLIFDLAKIGSKLHDQRKRLGMTQADVAERATLSDRTYADIERGSVNMRVETLLKICNALAVTPDDVLTEEQTSMAAQKEEICNRIDRCTTHEKRTILRLLSVYLDEKNAE